MNLKLIYPRWGSAHLEWPVFLSKVKELGYDGVEIDLPLGEEKKNIISFLNEYDLCFVGQHWETKSVNFEKHKDQYKRHLYNLAEGAPLLINSHTGMDFFSFEQNVQLLELADEIEKETGVTITHETHRSRFSFAAHVCLQYLKALPFLKLSADFSHWCCVAETMLENQREAVDLAIKNTYHVHARVGSAQTPQVIDPRSGWYENELKQFRLWWSAIFSEARLQNRSFISVTPEYGPIPYSPIHPKSGQTMADQWEINRFIKEELLSEWELL